MNNENGITSVWLCPACHERVVAALREIAAVFGTVAGYVYLGNRLATIAKGGAP